MCLPGSLLEEAWDVALILTVLHIRGDMECQPSSLCFRLVVGGEMKKGLGLPLRTLFTVEVAQTLTSWPELPLSAIPGHRGQGNGPLLSAHSSSEPGMVLC